MTNLSASGLSANRMKGTFIIRVYLQGFRELQHILLQSFWWFDGASFFWEWKVQLRFFPFERLGLWRLIMRFWFIFIDCIAFRAYLEDLKYFCRQRWRWLKDSIFYWNERIIYLVKLLMRVTTDLIIIYLIL